MCGLLMPPCRLQEHRGAAGAEPEAAGSGARSEREPRKHAGLRRQRAVSVSCGGPLGVSRAVGVPRWQPGCGGPLGVSRAVVVPRCQPGCGGPSVSAGLWGSPRCQPGCGGSLGVSRAVVGP